MSPFIFIVLASIANALASIFLVLNTDTSASHSSISVTRYFLLAIAFFGVNFLLYSKALEKIDVSVAYPLLVVISIAIIYAFSIYYYDKQVSYLQIFGSVLIAAGLYLVLRSGIY